MYSSTFPPRAQQISFLPRCKQLPKLCLLLGVSSDYLKIGQTNYILLLINIVKNAGTHSCHICETVFNVYF